MSRSKAEGLVILTGIVSFLMFMGMAAQLAEWVL